MIIGICEDEKPFLTYLSSVVEKMTREYEDHSEINRYQNPLDLEKDLKKRKHFDILFLDIEMPGVDGITLASLLRRTGADTKLVYVSGREELVFDTFRTGPFSFIPKSRVKEMLPETIRDLYAVKRKEDLFLNKQIAGKEYRFNILKLIYVECVNKTLYLHFTDQNLEITGKLSEMEGELCPYGFLRIHKGYLVNYRFIFNIKGNEIILDNHEVLPLSRYRANAVRKAFLELTE